MKPINPISKAKSAFERYNEELVRYDGLATKVASSVVVEDYSAARTAQSQMIRMNKDPEFALARAYRMAIEGIE